MKFNILGKCSPPNTGERARDFLKKLPALISSKPLPLDIDKLSDNDAIDLSKKIVEYLATLPLLGES
jgi:hypothetical protein